MATALSWSMTAQDTPGPVFTAYQDFYIRFVHTAGASVVALQQDLLDDGTWTTVATGDGTTEFSAGGTFVVEVPDGCASKFRTTITTLSTGPVGVAVRGKLNVNDTIGGASPGASLLDENGDGLLEEDASTPILDEAA